MSTPPLPIDQFAAKVRDKYPGAYDHLQDAELVDKIVAKYPEYQQRIAPALPAPKDVVPMESSYLAHAVSAPKMGLESGLASPAQDPDTAEKMGTGAAIGGVLGAPIAGGLKALPAVGRSLLGAAGGSALGGYSGREIGGIFGKRAGEIGGQIGATVGGLGGGVMGARGINVPAGRGGLLESLFAESKPVPELGSPQNPGESTPFKDFPLQTQLGLRRTARLAVTPPKPGPVNGPEPIPTATPFEGATSSARTTWTGSLPAVPEGKPTPFPQVQPKASLAAPQADPQWFPEPRPETPVDKPGSLWSVERNSLPARAQRGQPGALDVLANVGDRPPLVTPKPTLGVSDPEFQDLRARYGLAVPQEVAEADVPQGNAMPFESESSGTGRITTEIGRDGNKWAISPDGKYRVTIPHSLAESEIEAYAAPKLREQAEIHGKLFQ